MLQCRVSQSRGSVQEHLGQKFGRASRARQYKNTKMHVQREGFSRQGIAQVGRTNVSRMRACRTFLWHSTCIFFLNSTFLRHAFVAFLNSTLQQRVIYSRVAIKAMGSIYCWFRGSTSKSKGGKWGEGGEGLAKGWRMMTRWRRASFLKATQSVGFVFKILRKSA